MQSTTFFSKFIVAAALLAGQYFAVSDAYAEDRLTEDNVRKFIEKTSALIAGDAGDMSPAEVREYMDKHLEERAFFSSSLTYSVPGYPPQESALSLNKEDFLTSLEDGKQAVSNYSNNVTIESIAISKDGKKATVETIGTEEGIMPLDGSGGVPIEGQSSCLQILMLSDDGVIQMYSANCTTNVRFRD